MRFEVLEHLVFILIRYLLGEPRLKVAGRGEALALHRLSLADRAIRGYRNILVLVPTSDD
jgi:hypothetical protein